MDKLEELYIIDENDTGSENRLVFLARDEDEEIRYRAVEKLYPFMSSTVVRGLIIECLSDSDELVRVAALEVLEDWADPFALSEIKLCLKDDEWLVRAGAGLALAKVMGESARSTLIDVLSSVDNMEEKVRYIASLYIAGSVEYLNDLINFLADENYRVRCAAANFLVVCLSYTYSPCFSKKTIKGLKDALLEEKEESAKSSIKNAIEEIEGISESTD